MKDYTGGSLGAARRRKNESPDKTTLERYQREGLTEGQMAERWTSETPYTIGRTGVHEALKRHGLWERKLPRYDDLLPWVVASAHLMEWPARMLRLESKKRRGGALNSTEQRDLANWLEGLEHDDVVVTYHRDLEAGFAYVKRRDTDTDIIRKPEESDLY